MGQKKEKKHPGGRPTIYDPSYADILPDLFKDGQSVIEVCVELGIHKDTFYEWCGKHKEFSDAYALGLMYSEAWWQRLGRAGAAGAKVNPPMWRMNMMNRFKWTDRIDVTADVETLNKTEVLNESIKALSYDERKKLAEEWLEKHRNRTK